MTSITHSIKNRISPETRKRLRTFQRRTSYLKEYILGGGELRESILLKLLGHHYSSVYRREWQFSEEDPHFSNNRVSMFGFVFRGHISGPGSLYRGFFSSEVIRDKDALLDIGCGDGFLTASFFSARCSHVDAIDIEPTAIEAARKHNAADNIDYHLLDAVNQPFPKNEYNVIVWDGALGHFAPATTQHMFEKIAKHLAPDGIFVGSESLGVEGTDHLQFFSSLDDLYSLLKPYFKHIELRSIEYRINVGLSNESLRHEGFWRCSNDPKRLRDSHWHTYPSSDQSRRGK